MPSSNKAYLTDLKWALKDAHRVNPKDDGMILVRTKTAARIIRELERCEQLRQQVPTHG